MSTKAPNRDYKFTLNDDQISWSKPVIKGTELYAPSESQHRRGRIPRSS